MTNDAWRSCDMGTWASSASSSSSTFVFPFAFSLSTLVVDIRLPHNLSLTCKVLLVDKWLRNAAPHSQEIMGPRPWTSVLGSGAVRRRSTWSVAYDKRECAFICSSIRCSRHGRNLRPICRRTLEHVMHDRYCRLYVAALWALSNIFTYKRAHTAA